MTTITRYRNCLISDSRYLTLIGDTTGCIYGPPKFYKTPGNLAIVAIGGGISNYSWFTALAADINQAIVDLIGYPKTVPVFKSMAEILDGSEDAKERANREQLPTIMIVTKKLTCVVMFCPGDPSIVSVYPANVPVSIGTGSETNLNLLHDIVDEESLIDATKLAIMADSLSGGTLNLLELDSLGEL